MNIRLRHDEILRILRRRGTSTIDHLAEEVGASRRTILRDIAALRDQGFTIHSETGRGGGLQLDPASMQNTTRLTVVEVFALLISVATMRAAGTLPFSGLADSGLAKIEKSLPQEKVRDLRRLLDCLYIGKLSPQQDLSDRGATDAALLPVFEIAFLEKRHLRFHYRDAAGRRHAARLNPRPCSSSPRSGIWWHGIRHGMISAISEWTGSATRKSQTNPPSVAAISPLRMIFVRFGICGGEVPARPGMVKRSSKPLSASMRNTTLHSLSGYP